MCRTDLQTSQTFRRLRPSDVSDLSDFSIGRDHCAQGDARAGVIDDGKNLRTERMRHGSSGAGAGSQVGSRVGGVGEVGTMGSRVGEVGKKGACGCLTSDFSKDPLGITDRSLA